MESYVAWMDVRVEGTGKGICEHRRATSADLLDPSGRMDDGMLACATRWMLGREWHEWSTGMLVI